MGMTTSFAKSFLPFRPYKTFPRLLAASLLLLALQSLEPAFGQERITNEPIATAQEKAEPLPFKDFFQFPVGARGLEMSPKLQQLNGKFVQLVGYMVQQENGSKPGQFFFTPRPVQMSEHADGDADDLPPATVLVKLAPDQSSWLIPHARGLIQLQGTLSVGRQEADDGRVTWVQLQLKPEATRGMTASEFSNYLHSLQHQH
jgi:hypothetical protein